MYQPIEVHGHDRRVSFRVMMVRVDSMEKLRALRSDWDELYEASEQSNPFLTWEWLANWAQHLSNGFVALAERPAPGQPLSVAALFSTADPTRWAWIDEHSYRPGVLARRGVRHPLRPILKHVALRECAVRGVQLHRSLADAAYAEELRQSLGPFAPLCVESPCDEARIVATATSFEEYLASRPTKVRHELRRKAKKLETSAPGIHLLELDAAETGARAMPVVEAVERNSWKAASNTAIVSCEREQRFYEGVFALRSARTRGRLFYLGRRGDDGAMEHIGFVLGIQHDDVFYALKTSFREDFAALSPGQVLFHWLIEHFCDREKGVSRVELLGTDSRWKRELATESRAERCYEILRPSVAGIARAIGKKHVLPALRAAAAKEDSVLADVLARVKRVARPTA